MVDNSEERSMIVLDTWTGATSHTTDDHELSLTSLTLENCSRSRTCPPAYLYKNLHVISGSCQLPWDVVCSTFQGIYLNWNPAIFTHHAEFHGYADFCPGWKDKTYTRRELECGKGHNPPIRLIVCPV